MKAIQLVEHLKQSFSSENGQASYSEALCRLDYHVGREGLHLFFFGEPFDEPYIQLLQTIKSEPVANELASISFDGPDEGANGTRNWSLKELLSGSSQFPKLREFSIARTRPEHHNRTIVAEIYEEDGQIGELVARSPALESLTIPSAPGGEFFRKLANIRYLDVDAGFDTQGFIAKLAGMNEPFPLLFLGWGDYLETYVEGWEAQTTPFEHLECLFNAPVMSTLRSLHLRNSMLSDNQINSLARMKPELQILLINEASRYVRL